MYTQVKNIKSVNASEYNKVTCDDVMKYGYDDLTRDLIVTS